MNLSISKVSVGLIAGVMAFTTFTGFANAAEGTSTTTPATSTTAVSQEGLTQETINTVSIHIKTSPITNQFSIDPAVDIYKLVSKEQADLVIQSINEQNTSIQEQMNTNPQNYSIPYSDGSVSYNVSDAYVAQQQGLTPPMSDPLYASGSKYTSGITRIYVYWWGYVVYLSKYLINLAGSGGAAYIGYFVASLAIGPQFAGAIAVGLGMLGYSMSNIPYGVKMRINKTFLLPPAPAFVPTSVKFQSK